MRTSSPWRRASATALVIGALVASIGSIVVVPGTAGYAADATHATIRMHKGGDRTGAQTVGGLAGAVFDFFPGTAATPPAANAVPAFTCTTAGAAGVCPDFDVPAPASYWVRERSAPAGWTAPLVLDTGIGNATAPTTYNQLFLGTLNANTTYDLPAAQTGATNLAARGPVWADIRNNPALPDKCGLNIALLIDTSGSIAPFLPDVKTAAIGFVNALTGTPSQIALYRFAAEASQLATATPVSDAASAAPLITAINGLTAGGTTNWDQGLFQIAASPTTFDAVVMLTDGNPTVYGPTPDGPGDRTRFREVENGIFSANDLKALGSKVVAVGVGAGVSGAADNLQAISGPVAGQDYVQTGFDQLEALFRALALRTCAGTISVVKKVISPTGTVADAVPAGGWTFTTSTAGVTPASGTTDAATGATSFTADLSVNPTVPVTLTETAQTGFTLEQVAGLNATCLSNGAPIASTNSGPLGFTVEAARNAIVSCTVYNRAVVPPATVQVNKNWVINGASFPQGTPPPPEFQAALSLTGQTTPIFGQVYSGYEAGDTVTIGDVVDLGLLPPGCTDTATGDTGSHTLAAGANVFAINNTVTCATTLTLQKAVNNPFGPAAPADSWTLSAFPTGSQTPLFSGVSGVSNAVTPDLRYLLGESTVPGYAQEVVPGSTIVPPSTGSWHCRLRLRDNTLGPEFDGLNGGVTVQLGQRAECVANNTAQPAKLTLVNTVSGGTALPTDWLLHAVPPGNLAALTGRSGEGAVTGVTITPGPAYALSESDGPGGYTTQAPTCALTGTTTPVAVVDGAVTAGPGQDITCTFVNTAVTPPPTTPPPTLAPPAPRLPVTGTAAARAFEIGGGLMIVGMALLVFARRRRNQTPS